jgi:hypothetical protein
MLDILIVDQFDDDNNIICRYKTIHNNSNTVATFPSIFLFSRYYNRFRPLLEIVDEGY